MEGKNKNMNGDDMLFTKCPVCKMYLTIENNRFYQEDFYTEDTTCKCGSELEFVWQINIRKEGIE